MSRLSNTMIALAGAAAAVAFAGAASAQTAQTPSWAVTMTVPYSAQDLARPEGAQRLYGKIEAAARSLCEGSTPSMVFGDRPDSEACRRDAVNRTVAKINAPTLTQIAAVKSGYRPASTLVASNR